MVYRDILLLFESVLVLIFSLASFDLENITELL